ncbi:MAG: addiction module protein [Candidatus Hydrogenedentes bacterium]|nr:addiction module protein [Candidatus Hydrogenedentota bacterium]
MEIALRLFESVTDQCAPPLSAEWIEEIRSRMDELEAGTADCIPIEEFMQEIRAKLL